MIRRPFGSGGLSLPVVGQGTWAMERDDRREAIRALRRGVDLGLTHIDTAEMYGAGKVEELLREALQGQRDNVFLVSKVLPSHADEEGVLRACEESLSRLGTDRLDLYLLHWRERTPLEETFRAFERLQAAGKIARWGVSNFDVPDLEEAVRLADPGAISCNQILYHLEERAIEARVLPWCEGHGIPVVAYSPFGSGRFPAPGSAGGRVLEEVARRRSATPRQVALAFLLRRPSVFVIPKAARAGHVADNAGAAYVKLTAEDVAEIDRAFPRGKAVGLPMI